MRSLSVFLLTVVTLLVLHFPTAQASNGQCTSGDCYDSIGTFQFPDDERYEGEWKNSQKHGVGLWFFPEGSSYHSLSKNRNDGVGTFSWPEDVKYAGVWEIGRKNGVGKMSFPEDYMYISKLKDGGHADRTWTFPDGGKKSSTRVGSFKLR